MMDTGKAIECCKCHTSFTVPLRQQLTLAQFRRRLRHAAFEGDLEIRSTARRLLSMLSNPVVHAALATRS
jgi:hypothetical protein